MYNKQDGSKFQFLYGAIGSRRSFRTMIRLCYFNSYMVRLEEPAVITKETKDGNFNSYMVRLEEYDEDKERFLKHDFNSYMVRLEEISL